jgi:hypothetical protein
MSSIYVTPFLYACSDQTSMCRACMCDVCIRLEQLYSWFWKVTESLDCYGFYLSMVASLGRMDDLS